MRSAAITPHPIDPASVLAQVSSEADGAVLLFLGTVRRENEGRPVRGMRYDAYPEMAEQVLMEIIEEAGARFGIERLHAVHRTGELGLGEVSVAIAVGSPHRVAAYDASRYVIEEIKRRLPVWKHEHYLAGDSRWVEGVVPPVEGP